MGKLLPIGEGLPVLGDLRFVALVFREGARLVDERKEVVEDFRTRVGVADREREPLSLEPALANGLRGVVLVLGEAR